MLRPLLFLLAFFGGQFLYVPYSNLIVGFPTWCVIIDPFCFIVPAHAAGARTFLLVQESTQRIHTRGDSPCVSPKARAAGFFYVSPGSITDTWRAPKRLAGKKTHLGYFSIDVRPSSEKKPAKNPFMPDLVALGGVCCFLVFFIFFRMSFLLPCCLAVSSWHMRDSLPPVSCNEDKHNGHILGNDKTFQVLYSVGESVCSFYKFFLPWFPTSFLTFYYKKDKRCGFKHRMVSRKIGSE